MDTNNFDNLINTIPPFKRCNIMDFYYNVFNNKNINESIEIFNEYMYLLEYTDIYYMVNFLSLLLNKNIKTIKSIIINKIIESIKNNNNYEYDINNNTYIYIPDIIQDGMFQCENCGNIWDGNAQCDCFLF